MISYSQVTVNMSFAKAKRFSYSSGDQNSSQELRRQFGDVSSRSKRSDNKSDHCLRYYVDGRHEKSNEASQENSVAQKVKEGFGEPSFADILQRKVFVEENVDEITYYIPYTDESFVSDLYPQKRTPLSDVRDELRELQKKCQDLEQLLCIEKEAESSCLAVCFEQIQKAVDRTRNEVQATMDSATKVIGGAVNDDDEGTAKYRLIEGSVNVLEDIKANIKYYLDKLSDSVTRVLGEAFAISCKSHGSMDTVRKLIRKLERRNSESDELEAAQMKIIEQEQIIEYLLEELNSDAMESRMKRLFLK